MNATTRSPILLSIEYVQCVEGGARKLLYCLTLNLLCRDWISDKLAERELQEEKIITALTFTPEYLTHVSPETRKFSNSSLTLKIRLQILNLSIASGRQPPFSGSLSPHSESHCSQTTQMLISGLFHNFL